MSSQVIVYRPLTVLEADISEAKGAFLKVARALAEIRDGKLYKEAGYATFELYCQHRWGFTRDTGYQYLTAGKVAENVAPALPPGKAPGFKQARALAPLKPEQQREVVREIDLETAKVADVKAAVARKLGKPAPAPPAAKPPHYKGPPTDVVLRLAAPDTSTANGHTNTFLPFRLFPGFIRVEVIRDGRGYSTLAIWRQDGQAKQEKKYHDTDTAALAWVSSWLAAHQGQGGWTDLNCQGQESVS